MELEIRNSKLHIGTSGWTYDDWQGRFYPADVKGVDRLPYYAQHFDTVEVNATFYRLPTRPMISAWNRNLPPNYYLVVKGSRFITHQKRIKDCREALETFFGRVDQLKMLRVVLWQLPPSVRKDVVLLKDFIGLLPGHVRHAMEFRHASWWNDEVAELLTRHGMAFVTISHPSLPDTLICTTDFLYLRFHGPGELYMHNYSDGELADWADRLRPFLDGRTLYAFFNNDYHANAPKNAATLRGLLRPD